MIEWNKIEPKLGSWAPYFKPFYDVGGFEAIYSQLKKEGKNIKIVPEGKDLFRAFELCPANELKVIFLGQSPYPTIKRGVVCADGMCFSCGNTNEEQPSLKLIYDAIESDVYNGLNLIALRDTDLSYWAKQGILLLNSTLTVREGEPNSHVELWKPFIEFFFKSVLAHFSGIPIVMFGKQSQSYKHLVNRRSFHLFEREHPAFSARQQRSFDHQNVFSEINKILKGNINKEIDWFAIPF